MRIIACIAILVIHAAGAGFAEEGTAVPPGALYGALYADLERAEGLVAGMALQEGAAIDAGDMAALASLNRRIRGSLYSDLIDRSELLLLLAREQMRIHEEREGLQVRFDALLRESGLEERTRERNQSRERALRSAVIATAASFGLAFTCWGLGEWQDRQYFEATTIPEATLHRRLFQVFSLGSVIGAAAGTIGAGVSVTLYSVTR